MDNLQRRQQLIILAALTELDTRIRRGYANSHIEAGTAEIYDNYLRCVPGFHESDITELREKMLLQSGINKENV